MARDWYENIAMKHAKVTPTRMSLSLVAHTQDVAFPGVALRWQLQPMHTPLLEDWRFANIRYAKTEWPFL